MISIDDHPPPDPSSSHHNHHHQQLISHDLNINSDDKASASTSHLDLKSPDPDLDHSNPPLHNFSIRDHVFGLRSKDVACNWPFSPKSLQLCLKNGVKNLLPPFQPLGLLRDNSSLIRSCTLENLLPDEEIVSSFDGKPMDDDRFTSFTSDATKSTRELAKGDKEFQSSQKTENAFTQTVVKKTRLVMKLNSGVEPVDEITPNSFIVSETMASKVCPVCKIFSSSSNTTLNAHIDQCLTGEASMKWTDNPKVIVKHRIKPRKTRLMVDIYETAPHCTIEELDRRNGTRWATNSSFPAQEFQFQGEDQEIEEPRMMTTINSEAADNEGDVYIDTDGTKVRILSVPKSGSSDNNSARKLLKGVKGYKFVIGKKKSNIHKPKHRPEYLKLVPNGRKSCSPKPPRGASEAISGQEEDVAMAENRSKQERGREIKNARVHMEVADLAIVRPPWACSKRTGLAKKFSGKHRKLGTPPNSSNNADSSQSWKNTRTSSPLLGQPLTSSRALSKPSSRHLSEEDDREGADIRQTSNNFSSLRKNLSVSTTRFSFKRKFSAVEKSRVHCLLSERSVDEPSHNSSNERSEMEEDTDATENDDRSITSKSSNGESSVGIETAIEDALHEVESVRNETLANDAEGGLMSLSNSFDPEFSKLVLQADNEFDLHECDGVCRDQVCSTTRAPDGKNIFGNDIEDVVEDVEKHENYFEVDPIPIPGPPGSFLPSPRGDMVSEEMVSEEMVANSLLTTPIGGMASENQQHHDPMDRDSMSNSPVSTVSNPSIARSDSRSSDKLSNRSASVQDDARPVSRITAGFKNHEPCCCSRKETASSYSVASNYQESSNRSQCGLSFKSEMFSLSNYPTSRAPETTAKKSPTGLTVKLPVYSDCDSAASPSKPVLRLMGKNLTVVRTDDDVSSPSLSLQFRPLPSNSSSHHHPVIFSQYQNGSESQHFNVKPPIHGSFMASVDRYGHGGPVVPPSRYHHGHNGLNSRAASSFDPVKEIIVIDESPDDSIRNEFMRRNHLYTMYQPQSSADPYGGGGGGGSGGPSMFHGGGFATPAASTSHLRSSATYYPPSYP